MTSTFFKKKKNQDRPLQRSGGMKESECGAGAAAGRAHHQLLGLNLSARCYICQSLTPLLGLLGFLFFYWKQQSRTQCPGAAPRKEAPTSLLIVLPNYSPGSSSQKRRSWGMYRAWWFPPQKECGNDSREWVNLKRHVLCISASNLGSVTVSQSTAISQAPLASCWLPPPVHT